MRGMLYSEYYGHRIQMQDAGKVAKFFCRHAFRVMGVFMDARQYLRFFCLLPLFFIHESHAIGSFNPTNDELRMLPQYCSVRAASWGNDANDPRARRWFNVFGKDFIHMHHYCIALLEMRRADRIFDTNKRRSHLRKARSEFDYMERKSSPGFVLRPELLLNISIVMERLGDMGESLIYARQAVDAKPDYLKAVRHLADLLVRQGDRSEARAVLEEGLRKKPKASSIRRRIGCLDGKHDRLCPPEYLSR